MLYAAFICLALAALAAIFGAAKVIVSALVAACIVAGVLGFLNNPNA